MQLSRKQMILIVSLSGVAVLLLVGLLIFLTYFHQKEPVPAEPSVPPVTVTPAPTETPTPSPTQTATPQPTPYFLPLVPEGDVSAPTPVPAEPSASPSPTGTGTPEAAGISKNPRDGIYNDEIKEFMAIGTQNGEAIAVLLVRVEPPKATVVAIPCETQAAVYTLGENAKVERVDPAPIGTATARAQTER